MTRHTPALGQCRQRVQHRFGTAADEMLRRRVSLQELRDEAAEAEAAVVAGQVDRRAGGLKILDAGGELSSAHTVIQRDVLRGAARRSVAVAACAEQFADMGQKRRLTDAAGDESNALQIVKFRETVAERTPDLDVLARLNRCQQAGQLADDEINDIDGDGLAGVVEDGVVQREGPAQQRIRVAGQAEHEELAGADGAGQLGTVQAEAIGLAG